jgi:uncharacterized membrane protein HdeD (DUF308 family)
MAKKMKKMSSWLRAANLIIGFIILLLSLVVLSYPGLAITTLIMILAIGLIITGSVRIFIGFMDESISDKLRGFNVFIGLLMFVLAFIVIIYNWLTTIVLIYILAFSLLLNGLARFVIGGAVKKFPGWLRGFFVVIGALSIVLSFLIFIYPGLGTLTLVYILSIVLLLNSMSRIARGITGKRI